MNIQTGDTFAFNYIGLWGVVRICEVDSLKLINGLGFGTVCMVAISEYCDLDYPDLSDPRISLPFVCRNPRCNGEVSGRVAVFNPAHKHWYNSLELWHYLGNLPLTDKEKDNFGRVYKEFESECLAKKNQMVIDYEMNMYSVYEVKMNYLFLNCPNIYWSRNYLHEIENFQRFWPRLKYKKGLSDDEFWSLIELAKKGQDIKALITCVATKSDKFIFQFTEKLDQLLFDLDLPELAMVCDANPFIMTQAGFDAELFMFHRCGILLQGPEFYNRVFSDLGLINQVDPISALKPVPEKAWIKKHGRKKRWSYRVSVNPETFGNHPKWMAFFDPFNLQDVIRMIGGAKQADWNFIKSVDERLSSK